MFKIIFGFVMMVSSVSFAVDDTNLTDKKNAYSIRVNKKVVGAVTISSKFTGEGIIESTDITVIVKCAKGYRLDDKFKSNTVMHVYDYGAQGRLSEWNPAKNSARIFYRTGKLDDEQRVSVDQELTLDVSFSEACLK